MKRALHGCIAVLVIAVGFLTYKVVVLSRSLYRAEYFVQTGLVSVQQACAPVIDLIRRKELDMAELRSLGKGCFGQTNGVSESDEWETARESARSMADLIEAKLRQRRRLPWRSLSAPSREMMPVDYYDANARIE